MLLFKTVYTLTRMKEKIKILTLLSCLLMSGCTQAPAKSYDLDEVNNDLLNHTFETADLVDVDYSLINAAGIYIGGQMIDENLESFNMDSPKQQRTIFYTIGEDSRCCIIISELSLDSNSKEVVSVYLTMLWPEADVKSYEHIRSSQIQMGNLLFNVTIEGEDWYPAAYFLEEFADYIRDYN